MTSLTYKHAGVDVDANTRWVAAIKHALTGTYGPRVHDRRFGGFAGMFRLDYDEALFRRNYKRPVLVGCTDGVGTKILLALKMKNLSTIGIDLVAMNVNDLITCGAEPLFFLDYLAVHKLDPRHLLSVIEGIAAGCVEAGCALLGGETSEMPDLYRKGDIDLAGFAVGVVEYERVIDGSRVSPRDVVVALPSSGVHSNGYTLVRKLLEAKGCDLKKEYPGLGEPLGSALLRPTRIYVKAVQSVMHAYPKRHPITAMAHITGGGLTENLVRILPENCDAVLHRSRWTPPPVFDFLRRLGVTRAEMFKVFNMGLGYVFLVQSHFLDGVLRILRKANEKPIVIGRVQRGGQRVRFK